MIDIKHRKMIWYVGVKKYGYSLLGHDIITKYVTNQIAERPVTLVCLLMVGNNETEYI